MTWPLPQDFNEAIQSPGLAFLDPELKGGQPVVGAQGLPLPRSGNFADVYQLRGSSGRDFAVKCFTRPVVGLDHRYEQVGRALAKANLPFTVEFAYLNEGIRVGGTWRPVVKMDWVDGLQLNQFVRENAGKPAVLDALLQMWVRLCRRLREAGIAHADLQHGNVLLVPGTRPGALGLKLIDYDGMYIPALANKPSGESGHASYQHPHRVAKRAYSQDLDRFPHLVVATALQGLIAMGPKLWDRYDTGDNLLFQESDFQDPAASELMRELWQHGDTSAKALVGHLAVACRKPIPQTPWLDQIAPDGAVTPLIGKPAKDAAEALGLAQPMTAPAGSGSKEQPPVAVPVAHIAAPPRQPAPVAVPAAEPPSDSPFANVGMELERPRPTKRKPPVEKSGSNRMLIIGAAVVAAIGIAVGAVLMSGGKPDETAQAGANDKKDDPPAPKEDRKEKKDDRKEKKQPTKGPTVPPDPRVGGNNDPPDPPVNNPPAVAADGPALDGDPATAPVLTARWEVPGSHNLSLVRFSPDSRLVAIERWGSPVQMVSARTGEPVSTFTGHTGLVFGVAPFRADLMLSVGAGEGHLLAWNPATGARVTEVKCDPDLFPNRPSGIGLLEASADGRYVAVGRPGRALPQMAEEPGLLKVIDTQSGNEVLSVPIGLAKIAFAPDGQFLVADAEGMKWYELPSGRLNRTISYPPPIGRPIVVACSADATRIVIESGRDKRVLDPRTGNTTAVLPERMFSLFYGTALSPNGRHLVAGTVGAAGDQSAYLEVLDLQARRIVGRLRLPNQPAATVSTFSPDGKSVAVGRANGVALGFDLPPDGVAAAPAPAANPPGAAAELRPAWTQPVRPGIRFSPVYFDADSRYALLGSRWESSIVAHDTRTGAPVPGFATVSLSGIVRSLFALENGVIGSLASGDPVVQLWQAGTGKSVGKIVIPDVPADENVKGSLVVPSPNGKYIAVSRYDVQARDADSPLRVFDTTTQNAIVSLDWKHGSVHFTADSSRALVQESNGRFRWFKLSSGQPDGEWDFGRAPPPRYHTVLDVSADGTTILYTGPLGKNLQTEKPYLLDGKTGEVVREFPGNFSMRTGSMSADGRVVALMRQSGGENEVVIDVFNGAAVVGSARVATPQRGIPLFAVSPDGRHLVVYRRDELIGFALAGNAAVAANPAPANPNPAPMNPVPMNPAPAAADPPAGEVVELREKWSTATDAKTYAHVRIDRTGRYVILAQQTGLAADRFDARTGAPGPSWSPGIENRSWRMYPLDGSKVGFISMYEDPIHIWDAATNRATSIPMQVPDTRGGLTVVRLSPNERYVAYSRWSPSTASAKGKPVTVPLRIAEVRTNRTVLTLDWQSGTIHFTPDSSRVLVVDAAGRFRWFRLPGGQADGDWTFEKEPRPGLTRDIHGSSARGDTILYYGSPDNRPDGFHLLDGRTGKVTKSFGSWTHSQSSGAISDDGGVIALIRNDGFGVGHTVEVYHTPGRLVAKVKIPGGGPRGNEGAVIGLSADGRFLAMHNRFNNKLTYYEVPLNTGAAIARPGNTDPANPAAKGDRLPVPADDALTKAETNVRAVLKDDYARKLPTEKKAFAQKLLGLAGGTNDDPTARYVMLRDAQNLAAEVGDPSLAVQAIDAMARWYDIDSVAAKVAALEKTLSATTSAATLRTINELATAGADDADDVDNYVGAAKLAQVAVTAARKGAGLGQAGIDDAEFRLAYTKKMRDAFELAQPALEKLKSTPDDPEQNLVAGKFRYFVQGRWADGAKLLAKGSNAALKLAAEQEMAAAPSGVVDVKVADAWWDFAQAAPDAEKRIAEARARYWYGRAVPGLAGLARARVEGRLGFTHNNVEYKPGLLAEFSSKVPSVLKGKKARIDAVIDFSAGEFAEPGKSVDVAVKWTGVMLPPRPGRYKLMASGTDVVRIRVDGRTLIDTSVNRTAKREGSVLLPERPVALVVEFASPNTATHQLKLSWVPAGDTAEEPVPAEALFHDRKAEAVLGK